jgi:hypothetical protein
MLQHQPLLIWLARWGDANAHEEFFVVGIREGVEGLAAREPSRRLVDPVQLRRRSGDQFVRRVIAQNQRASVDEQRQERARGLDRRHVAAQSGR